MLVEKKERTRRGLVLTKTGPKREVAGNCYEMVEILNFVLHIYCLSQVV